MIPIVREPAELTENVAPIYEQCCFCGDPSPYWYEKNDVCICKKCAAVKNVKDVPTKKEWFENVKANKNLR